MKKKILFVFLILLYVFTGTNCEKKKNPTEPEEDPPDTTQYVSQPQTDIPWPTLANSPCPIANYNPQRVARSKYKGPQQGKIKWTLLMGGKATYAPVVGVDGTIYLTAVKPGSGYSLYAVSPEGQIKWEFNQPEQQFHTSPIIAADNSIILGTAFDDKPGGMLYFINPDGSVKSQTELSTGIFCRGGVIDLEGNLYYTGKTFWQTQGLDHYIYSFTNEGVERWKTSEDIAFDEYAYISISPDGTTLFALDGNKKDNEGATIKGLKIYAISAADGTIIWSENTNHSGSSAAVVDNEGNIYTYYKDTGESGIISYQPSGQVRWKFNFSEMNVFKTMDTYSEFLGEMCICYRGYIFSYYGAKLLSCDYVGQQRWLQELPSNSIRGETPVTCDMDSTIYLTAGSYFYAYDQEGQMLFECKFSDYHSYAGALACGSVAYILDATTTLIAIE